MNEEIKPIGPLSSPNLPGGPAPLPGDNSPSTPPSPLGGQSNAARQGGDLEYSLPTFSSPAPPPASPPASPNRGESQGGPSSSPSATPPLGTGSATPTDKQGPEPPPPPQIDIRTLGSDSQTLEATGGLGAEPKTFSPSELNIAPDGATLPMPQKKSSRMPLLIAGGIGILAVAGVAAYFFVWPLFSDKDTRQITPPPPPPLPDAPPGGLTHQTLFAKPPTVNKELKLSEFTIGEINVVLRIESGQLLPAGSIKEIWFKDKNNLVIAENFLKLYLPGSGVERSFEDDFTGFFYYTDKIWPGYIFQLKTEADIESAKEAIAKLEKTADWSVFYPESPGAPSKAGFKSGKIGDIETRYLPFATKNASLNYGWFNNYLIISTSFDGFKKATELLKP